MPHLLMIAFGLGSALALAACTPPRTHMTTEASASEHDSQAKSDAAFNRNPHPKQAYQVIMTIADAPGPFALMKALAQYDVVNKECLRPPNDNPGGYTSPVPTEDVEIPLTKVSENEYVGTVHADQMLDEDYNGRGVCRWELIQFRVRMKATGADGETRFVPSIPDRKLLAGESETVYFNNISYPQLGAEEFVNTGLSDRSRFGPEIQDDDLFTVTFTPSKEAAP